MAEKHHDMPLRKPRPDLWRAADWDEMEGVSDDLNEDLDGDLPPYPAAGGLDRPDADRDGGADADGYRGAGRRER